MSSSLHELCHRLLSLLWLVMPSGGTLSSWFQFSFEKRAISEIETAYLGGILCLAPLANRRSRVSFGGFLSWTRSVAWVVDSSGLRQTNHIASC